MHEVIRIWLGREAEDARLISEGIPPAPEFSEQSDPAGRKGHLRSQLAHREA